MRTSCWWMGLALSGLVLGVGCSSGDQLKRVENEVGDLKLEVYKLRAQMEEANRKGDEDRSAHSESRSQDLRFQADLQETMRQLKDSTRVLSNRLGESVARAKARPAQQDAAPTAAVSEDEKAYTAAVLDYNRGNYALAAEGLELFLKANADSPRRPDALFTLGLCWYNQKTFDKAKPLFEQVLKEHANSNQFLPAKLKRAQCLTRMGLKAAAVKAYQEINDGFKGSPEARTAQQELNDLGF